MAFLAFPPLSLGLLTGKVGADRQFPASDMRASHPRFTSDSRRRANAAAGHLQLTADELARIAALLGN